MRFLLLWEKLVGYLAISFFVFGFVQSLLVSERLQMRRTCALSVRYVLL